MTLEEMIINEIEIAGRLLETVKEAQPAIRKYPNYANLGDLRRYNIQLREIIDIFMPDRCLCLMGRKCSEKN